MNILTLYNLDIGYKEKTVAERLNASLKAGALTCLVGRNGTGKSTLLRTLSAIQPPLRGRVMLGEKDLSSFSRQQLAKEITIVKTGRPEISLMKVYDVVALGRTPYTNMWGTMTLEDHAIVSECIARVAIENLSERAIGSLSDGECQKVMIAKALAQQTRVILLDEPTAFLDYPSKVETMMLIKDIIGSTDTRGSKTENIQHTAALMSTHDMDLALRLADYLWLMTSDHELLCGTPEELHSRLSEENLSPKVGGCK